RQAEGQIAKDRPGLQPSRHEGALPPRSRNFWSKGALQTGARVQNGALQGLFVWRSRDPLVLRQGASARGGGRTGESHFPFRRRPEGVLVYGDQRRRAGPSRYLSGQGGQNRSTGGCAMGRRVDRR